VSDSHKLPQAVPDLEEVSTNPRTKTDGSEKQHGGLYFSASDIERGDLDDGI
jgi:hypothetical protein